MPVHPVVGMQDNVGTHCIVGTHWFTGNVGKAAALAPPAGGVAQSGG